jgi:hypothetical protein
MIAILAVGKNGSSLELGLGRKLFTASAAGRLHGRVECKSRASRYRLRRAFSFALLEL